MSIQQEKIQKFVEKFEGKTIGAIDASSVNLWTILFTDGTKLVLETELSVVGIHAIMPVGME
jgi:hypothetical protein